MNVQQERIGYVIGGSLREGIIVRLAEHISLDVVKAGKFVCVVDDGITYLSMVTDVILQPLSPEILSSPPHEGDELLHHVLRKHMLHVDLHLRPMLVLNQDRHILPPKMIPRCFSPLVHATPQDIADIFGRESAAAENKYFNIGTPIDMTTPVCIDLNRLVERSTGIFGRSGTGKTFLTRLLLAAIVKKEAAVNLVFDMHSEYGLLARSEGAVQFVHGLKTLFPSQVAIFSLDPVSTRRRGSQPDVEVRLSYQDITVEDVAPLQDELNLHPTALEAAYLIASVHKEKWLEALFEGGRDIKAFAESIGAHAESVAALHRKLKRLQRFSFLTPDASSGPSVVELLLNCLERGTHVIIEFGTHTSLLCYLLIANVITRRLHEAYVRRTEQFFASRCAAQEPKKLLITIEEAHKFLNPQAARQTIFGMIAREMRKYYVSLLIVDQRPSGIDQEIISQIGTKISALLSDERDIAATLTGQACAGELRSVLASLDTKKQVLILGHALPMPLVVRSRDYDDAFYAAMQAETVPKASIDRVMSAIFQGT